MNLVQAVSAMSLIAICNTHAAEPANVAVSGQKPARPNIVLILVDDMGYGDAGCYQGTAFPTPNLDRMAAEGIKFTDFHSSGCVCSPTRAGLLTGRYQQRAGIPGVVSAAFNKNRHHGLQTAETTFAEIFASAGYQTAMFGKWHLGYEEKYNPVHHGFQDYVGYVSGNIDFHSHIDGAGMFDWWHQNKLSHETGYTTHLITNHACQFVSKAAASERPFCLYVAHEAPHDPYQGPGDKPVRKEGNGKPTYDHREPSHAKRAYAEMMIEMDKGVGQLIEALEQSNVDSNTLVMFFSDNGATGPGSCAGLYGMKGTLWEGGHRVPCLARWPGRIPAGAVTDQLASTIDIMPTMLDYANIKQQGIPDLDGVSLRRTLQGKTVSTSRAMFWEYGKASAVRDGNWKLVVEGGKPLRQDSNRFPNINWKTADDGRERVALFDLGVDMNESKNLATQHPERVTRMKDAIRTWRTDVRNGATQQPD